MADQPTTNSESSSPDLPKESASTANPAPQPSVPSTPPQPSPAAPPVESKRSNVFGILSLAIGIINIGVYFIPSTWILVPILAIAGLVLGILGLKSDTKILAIFGIVLNGIMFLIMFIAFMIGFVQGFSQGFNSTT